MSDSTRPLVSVIVLSYNRPNAIKRNISELCAINLLNIEIIVVDNNSDIPVSEFFYENQAVHVLRLSENKGVGGRNEGIIKARGDYIITLDDDVFGLSDSAVSEVVNVLENRPSVGALNFRIIDDVTEEQTNWCHHRKVEDWCCIEFPTYEISEGAVAFRASALDKAGLYPEYFFISHEGPDLAIRLMNCGYDVIYNPEITVRHAHAKEGRPDWRRYYYDTRNIIWLAMRCYSLSVALRKVPVSIGSLFVYSIRDGYTRFWFKAVRDSFIERKMVVNDRIFVAKEVWEKYREIEKYNAGFLYMAKRRIFRKGVGI